MGSWLLEAHTHFHGLINSQFPLDISEWALSSIRQLCEE